MRFGRPLVLWAPQVYEPIVVTPPLEALDGVEHQAKRDDQRRGFPPREPPIAAEANEVTRDDLTHLRTVRQRPPGALGPKVTAAPTRVSTSRHAQASLVEPPTMALHRTEREVTDLDRVRDRP